MKRLIAVLLLGALLTGCGPQNATESTQPSSAALSTEESVAPTEPNTLLQSQDSSIATFCIDRGCCAGILPWGEESIAMFTTDGRIMLLSGEDLEVENTRDLGCQLNVGDPSLAVKSDQIGYYDSQRGAYVTLGKNLTEISAITIRDELIAEPLMSPDFSTAYYCTESGVRAVDMSTGNSRLVRQEHEPILTLDGILFDGGVLRYTRRTSDDQNQTCFIRTTDGSQLYSVNGIHCLTTTWDENCAAVTTMQLPIGRLRQILTATPGSEPQLMAVGNDWSDALFPGDGTLLLQTLRAQRLILELYDLNTGCIQARTTFDRTETFPCAGKIGSDIWLWDGAQREFYRWEHSLDALQEESVLTAQYTLNDPNHPAMDQVTPRLDALSEQHGVTLRIAGLDNRTAGVDYSAYADYRPELYLAAVDLLEETLAQLPQGLFAALQKDLVIELADDYDPATGVHHYDGSLQTGDETVIQVSISNNLPAILYHELFHAMELEIYSQTSALTDWESLNPEDFEYTFAYQGQQSESPYLAEGENAFTDDYGMVSPREDRAQIFMYAMMEGESARFQSERMQAKLAFLCQIIREVFGWEDVADAFPWEQYLNS